MAYYISIETYSRLNPMPWPLDRVPMLWIVRCERGHTQTPELRQQSLFGVEA